MLKVYKYDTLSSSELEKLIARNTDQDGSIEESVSSILQDVKQNGDSELFRLAEKFDHIALEKLSLGADEIEDLAYTISRESQRSLEIAFQNIHKFHSYQNRRERIIETMPGVKCWRENRPIEKVGLYIPGGTAVLPSTLLMLGTPARIAGCKEIVVCTPPNSEGKINGYVAYCLKLLQIKKVYLVGGAQAVAAMAYGTESIPKVDKIFGPGNQYVTMAKKIVLSSSQTSIDMPAGPSEVLVLAGKEAQPAFVAADLIAQAEHGADSQAILVSESRELILNVNTELKKQVVDLPRKEFALKALENSYAIEVSNMDEGVAFSNLYAPEHLIVQMDDWEPVSRKVQNAGSVFLGHLTPESAGDYASGTNHTLPTSGYARAYSGVSVDSFVKKITFQTLNEEGVKHLGGVVEVLAEIEELEGHRRAMAIRSS